MDGQRCGGVAEAGLGLTNKYQHTTADQFIVSVVPSSPARAHGAGATAAAADNSGGLARGECARGVTLSHNLPHLRSVT